MELQRRACVVVVVDPWRVLGLQRVRRRVSDDVPLSQRSDPETQTGPRRETESSVFKQPNTFTLMMFVLISTLMNQLIIITRGTEVPRVCPCVGA